MRDLIDIPDDSPWLDVAGTAQRAGRHAVTVRRALETGELHGHQRRHRGRWQIHINAVDGWIRGERDLVAACGCAAARRHRAA